MIYRLTHLFPQAMFFSSPVLALAAMFLGSHRVYVADPGITENLYIGAIGALCTVIGALFWQLMKSRDEQVKILRESYAAMAEVTKALSALNSTLEALQESLKIKETLDLIGVDRRKKG